MLNMISMEWIFEYIFSDSISAIFIWISIYLLMRWYESLINWKKCISKLQVFPAVQPWRTKSHVCSCGLGELNNWTCDLVFWLCSHVLSMFDGSFDWMHTKERNHLSIILLLIDENINHVRGMRDQHPSINEYKYNIHTIETVKNVSALCIIWSWWKRITVWGLRPNNRKKKKERIWSGIIAGYVQQCHAAEKAPTISVHCPIAHPWRDWPINPKYAL